MGGEPYAIPFHLFIETFSGDAVEFCEIFIQQDPLTPEDIDCFFNSFRRDQAVFRHVVLCIVHIVISLPGVAGCHFFIKSKGKEQKAKIKRKSWVETSVYRRGLATQGRT